MEKEIQTQGLSETSGSMKNALNSFVSARIELASIEAKEATVFAKKKAAAGLILSIALFFTWALVLAGLIGILAPLFDKLLADKLDWLPAWTLVVIILAALHALIAMICVSKLKKKSDVELFELSRREIQNDKKWLSKQP